MNYLKWLGVLALLVVAGCTRVETNEVGLARSWNGVYDMTPIQGGTGYHQSITQTIYLFTTKEVLLPIKNLKPQTKDKMVMDDVELSYSYYVNPAAVPELYVKYAQSAHWEHDGEIYVMANFVEALLRSAVNDAVLQYDALEVNNNREAIREYIRSDVQKKLHEEGLDGKVIIRQVVITTLQPPKAIVASATQVVTAQNELNAARIHLQTTQVEAQRIKAQAEASDGRYVQLLQAQAMLKMAEKAPAYVIVPMDFAKGGMVNMPAVK